MNLAIWSNSKTRSGKNRPMLLDDYTPENWEMIQESELGRPSNLHPEVTLALACFIPQPKQISWTSEDIASFTELTPEEASLPRAY